VGLQTNREMAHLIGEKESRGCTSANSWRDYPFLRMPHVHVDAGPAGSPTPEQMIADTRDGVLIDGRGCSWGLITWRRRLSVFAGSPARAKSRKDHDEQHRDERLRAS